MNTLLDPIKHAVKAFPENISIIFGKYQMNYSDLYRRCLLLGNAIYGLGAKPGDRIAVLSSNSHQYIELYLGVPASGLVIVPLNTRHSPQELAYVIRDSGAKILFTDRKPAQFLDMIRTTISIPVDYERLIMSADRTEFCRDLSEDSLAGLFYTGGTTGESKGVMLSHRNLIANSSNWSSISEPRPTDIFVVMSPLFHAAGSNSIISSIRSGGAQLIIPKFDPKLVLDQIAQFSATQTLGVPTMIAALNDEQEKNPRNVSSMRTIAHGGAPISSAIISRAMSIFPSAELIHLYGATETSPLATGWSYNKTVRDKKLLRSCGQALPGVKVCVLDKQGRELEPGDVGEIVIAGANVMMGYWNKPVETQTALRNGCYYSGDLGYADRDGYIYLVDRAKDMIITGGENVYSTEVEEVLSRHVAVIQCAVFGVPDSVWGETVHATIQVSHDVEVRELIEFCQKYIANYKTPKTFDLTHDPLPLSGPGKVLKRELRKPYWYNHTKISR